MSLIHAANSVGFIASTSVLLIAASSVNAQSNASPELALQDRFAQTGKTIQFVVSPTDQDGVVPGVFLKYAPPGAELADNLDGTRTFNWKTDKPGTYRVTFTVVDGQDKTISKDVDMEVTVDVEQVLNEIKKLAGPKKRSSDDGSFAIGNHIHDVEKILQNLPVSESQLSVQQTPIDVADGYVYISNIEPGYQGDGIGLPQKTVLRQGVQNADGGWEWDAHVVDDRTIFDMWHTAPSVAVDKAGHIHVAYNMHYMPWQYKRSVRPHQIQEFDFLGQRMSEEQRNKLTAENYIDFPTLGTAAIPGNQITYPAFYKDRNEDLFISYRFAATPKRRFSERTVSTGIASYNTDSGKWRSVGGNVPLSAEDYALHSDAGNSSVAFAGQRGWTSYHPQLAFDNNNQMYINWFWRMGRGGSILQRPCLIVSPDRHEQFLKIEGEPVSTPISPHTCGNLGYPNDKQFLTFGNSAINNNGVPHLLLSPKDEARQIIRFESTTNSWVRENAPHNATEIFFDRFNSLWAISSGPRIFKRESGQTSWQEVYNEGAKTNCYPRAVLDESVQNAFIYTQACNAKSVTVYALRLH